MRFLNLTIAFTTIFNLGFIQSTFAQSTFSYGPLLGFNRTNIVIWNGDEAGQWNPKSSFSLGLSTELSLTEDWTIQVNPLITGRGYSIKDFFNYRLNLTYLEVPILVKYNQKFIELGEGLSAYGLLGPFINVGISAKAKTDLITDEVSLGSNEDDDFKAFVFGGTLGVGINFPVANSMGALQITGSLGLSDADNIERYSSHFTNLRLLVIYYIK